jgi:hypothetical protein
VTITSLFDRQMTPMRKWLSQMSLRLKVLIMRDQFDRDLQDELAHHLAMREQKK